MLNWVLVRIESISLLPLLLNAQQACKKESLMIKWIFRKILYHKESSVERNAKKNKSYFDCLHQEEWDEKLPLMVKKSIICS